MNSEKKLWVIIPAAGIGQRFNGSVPKQYERVNDQPLLSYTLKTFLNYEKTHRVVVAINENDNEWSSLVQSDYSKVSSVDGGDTRMHSVYNALQSLQTEVKEDDWICVHDAARPGLTLSALEAMMAKISSHSVGGVMGLPVVDTLKKVTPTQEIKATIDRTSLWRAQTPQIFRYAILQQALDHAINQGVLVTDESSAVEALGYSPLMILGDERNAKITVREDLELFRYWVNQGVLF
jgi:2-C-methyl-D-erythritol 4-phosphate cytidylyltransferase